MKEENKHIIENVDTQKGEEIISALRKNKWKLLSQYYLFAFDKGIDYDDCRLKKNDEELYFEWDNWFEWKVVGSKQTLEKIVRDFSLEQDIKPKT